MANDTENTATPVNTQDSDENVTMTKEQFDQLMGRIANLEKQNKKTEKAEKAATGAGAATAAFDPVAENEARMKELVDVVLFKDNGKYKDDVFVSVNGKTYQIKRGVTVRVPRFVKEVLDSSTSQDRYAAQYSEGLTNEYEAKSK